VSRDDEAAALRALGWDEGWDAALADYARDDVEPGRVAASHRGGAYDVLTASGEVRARLPGRARREADAAELPVVGDWLAVGAKTGSTGPTIEGVLPRRTKLSRRAAHEPGADRAREQVVAANVDVVFVTASLADEANPRLLERYLTLAWESGARPVVLLTKADLEPDPERRVAEIAPIAGETPVIAVSTRTGSELGRVRAVLEPGTTGSLIGPSGVGKSTLVNALAGEELLATGSLATDGSGRHTTTRRQLVVLPGGGILVDNPGIRELYLWVAREGLEEAFADVVDLAAHCRFADCRHETEPGCAIRAALADGTLAPDRWASYRELERELEALDEQLERQERSRARRGKPGTGGP
jgi:ribosome biogenesis GTPase